MHYWSMSELWCIISIIGTEDYRISCIMTSWFIRTAMHIYDEESTKHAIISLVLVHFITLKCVFTAWQDKKVKYIDGHFFWMRKG